MVIYPPFFCRLLPLKKGIEWRAVKEILIELANRFLQPAGKLAPTSQSSWGQVKQQTRDSVGQTVQSFPGCPFFFSARPPVIVDNTDRHES